MEEKKKKAKKSNGNFTEKSRCRDFLDKQITQTLPLLFPLPHPDFFFAPYSSSKKQFKVESLGLCFLTCPGSSFNCENVQSENLTWQQFLHDLALAVKSTSALQEQIFIVFSGKGTKRFLLLLLFFFKRKLHTGCVLCFLPALKVKSAVLFSLFPAHFISPKK